MKNVYLLVFAIFALLVGVPSLEAEEFSQLPQPLGLVGSYDTYTPSAYGITISGNYAYIADGLNGLVIINP